MTGRLSSDYAHADALARQIPAQRPPPTGSDPWSQATETGARAFRTSVGEPEVRAAAAVAAALFVYAERMGHYPEHRLVIATGKHSNLWVAARCECGRLQGAERRGVGAADCVMSDYRKHLNGEE